MPKLLTQGVSLEPKNGRQLIGIVAGFKSERWPVIDRNAGRLQLGIRRRQDLGIPGAARAQNAVLIAMRLVQMTALREAIAARLAAGEVIHMELTPEGRKWWFEQPRLDIDDATMVAIRTDTGIDLREYKDSLFRLPGNSQTWRAARSRK